MIIGISGKIGSGKSTLKDLLLDKTNNIYKRKSFADNLKKAASIITGENIEKMYSQKGKNFFMASWGMTVGEFLQKFGTEGLRNGVHDNGWVISLFSKYTSQHSWIIDDVRFPNEAKAIKDLGGILIRIQGDPALVRDNSQRKLEHQSEIALDYWRGWDYVMTNKPPIENLISEVDKIVEKFNL